MARIAAIQMCSSHRLNENLIIAEALIADAVRQHAKLIVLPENFACLPLHITDYHSFSEESGKGQLQQWLSRQAQLHQIWIVGGSIPLKSQTSKKLRAASLLYNDQGNCVARYDKIHLFDAAISESEAHKESSVFENGTKLTCCETPLGKLGFAICYDIRFPELFRCLWKRGAEIFAIPAAFTKTTGEVHWEVLMRSRAIENFAYCVGAAQVGTHSNGRKTFGHSMIVGPWGDADILSSHEASIIHRTIDLDQLKRIRSSIPTYLHHKISQIS